MAKKNKKNIGQTLSISDRLATIGKLSELAQHVDLISDGLKDSLMRYETFLSGMLAAKNEFKKIYDWHILKAKKKNSLSRRTKMSKKQTKRRKSAKRRTTKKPARRKPSVKKKTRKKATAGSGTRKKIKRVSKKVGVKKPRKKKRVSRKK